MKKGSEKKIKTMYGRAGNLYSGGGIPRGFGIISWPPDDYFSTFLGDPRCEPVKSVAAAIARRNRLSFWNAPFLNLTYGSGRLLWNRILECKMHALKHLLEHLSVPNSMLSGLWCMMK